MNPETRDSTMRDETYFIVAGKEISGAIQYATIANAFASLAGRRGSHRIEEHNTARGLVREWRLTVKSFKLCEEGAN